jgi:uncharacterized membrane protein YcaP (DUF421 family)
MGVQELALTALRATVIYFFLLVVIRLLGKRTIGHSAPPAACGALALRASITYVVLLLLLRLVGKRTVKDATPFDFVVAIVVGDFPDDVIWGEVPMVQGLIRHRQGRRVPARQAPA